MEKRFIENPSRSFHPPSEENIPKITYKQQISPEFSLFKDLLQSPQSPYQSQETILRRHSKATESPISESSSLQKPFVDLPFFNFQIHGGLFSDSFKRSVHLQKGEFIICPDWDLLSRKKYGLDITQFLERNPPKDLKQLLISLTQMFPPTKLLEQESRSEQPIEFQLFDHTKPLPNLFMSTNCNPNQGLMYKMLESQIFMPISRLGIESIRLQSLVRQMRKVYPDGWILLFNICSKLDVSEKNKKHFRDLLKTKYKGFRLFEYFSKFQFYQSSPKSPFPFSFFQTRKSSPNFIIPKREPTPSGCKMKFVLFKQNFEISFGYLNKSDKSFVLVTLITFKGKKVIHFKNKLHEPNRGSFVLSDFPCMEFSMECPFMKSDKIIPPKLSLKSLYPVYNVKEFTLRRNPPLFNALFPILSYFRRNKRVHMQWQNILVRNPWFSPFQASVKRIGRSISNYFGSEIGELDGFLVEFLCPFSFVFLILYDTSKKNKILLVLEDGNTFTFEELKDSKKKENIIFFSDFISTSKEDCLNYLHFKFVKKIASSRKYFSQQKVLKKTKLQLFFFNSLIQPNSVQQI